MKQGKGAAVAEPPTVEDELGLSEFVRNTLVNDLRSWGIQYKVGMRHGDHACPRCSTPGTGAIIDYKHVVGFSFKCQARQDGRPEAAGAIIAICPECLKYFWFHISHDRLRFYRRVCPNWANDTTVSKN